MTALLTTTETISIWNIDVKLKVKIVSAGNLNVSKDTSVSEILLLEEIHIELTNVHVGTDLTLSFD